VAADTVFLQQRGSDWAHAKEVAMRLFEALQAVAELPEPKELGAFAQGLEPEWIEQALQHTGKATLRRRRLPAAQVVWLVIGMALFRNRPIWDVVDKLDLALADRHQPVLARSASIQARGRLGEEPMQWLFERCGRQWAHDSADRDRYRGLALYGVDGTTMKVPDSEHNREHFGLASGGDRGDSGYPLLRMTALMALRSHLLAKAAFGPYGNGEYHYASQLWGSLPDDSLCVVDRNFWSAALLLGLQNSGRERHWLIRGKKGTHGHHIQQLGPSDELIELKVSPQARKRDPSLPATWTVRILSYQIRGYRPQRLITSLLDPVKYPPQQLVALYHERWELELGYDEIKTQMLRQTQQPLRSRSPAAIRQELWGVLIAYNLIRLEMQRVADEAGAAPTRISFVAVYRMICDEWRWSLASPGAIPRHLRELQQTIERFILPERRPERAYPRAVKVKMSKYPKKQRSSTSRESAKSKTSSSTAGK
jgi:hypothetical protein